MENRFRTSPRPQPATTRKAAAVFLSPKTVEYHLRNVYRKLRISSRQELARVSRIR